MSFIQRVLGFGSKKNEQPPNISSAEAAKNLSGVEEMLGKRQVLLESQIDEEKQKAVALSKQGNKRAAIGAMKRMKRYEKTLSQIDGTLTTLEMQRESLHDAASNVEVFRVMRTAATALKKSNAHLTAEDVEQLKDDLDEQNQLADDVARAISTPAFGGDLYDNDELERELTALANEGHEEEPILHPRSPDVPQTKIQKNKKEDPLKKLADFAS